MPVQPHDEGESTRPDSVQYSLLDSNISGGRPKVLSKTHFKSLIERKKLDDRSKFFYAGTRLFQHFILHIKTPPDK